MRRIALLTVVFGLCAFAAPPEKVPMTDFTITGTEAWSEAKTYGFQFYPEVGSTGGTITTPYDGVNTRLLGPPCFLRGCVREMLASTYNGSMYVSKPATGSRTVTFSMFRNRKLQPGWTVTSVQLEGSPHTYQQTPRYGTDDMSFRVSVTAYATTAANVQLKSVTLRGPAGGDWRHAFSAPERREFTVPGITAWSTAKSYGFEFVPAFNTQVCRNNDLRGGSTGENTELVWLFPNCTLNPLNEVVASVVGGNMIVSKTNHSQDFVMYRNKRLAPGWIVKSVQISAGTWIEQPQYGTDNMRFVVRLRSYNSTTSAIVKSIVLEGPSNAVNWQDAFK